MRQFDGALSYAVRPSVDGTFASRADTSRRTIPPSSPLRAGTFFPAPLGAKRLLAQSCRSKLTMTVMAFFRSSPLWPGPTTCRTTPLWKTVVRPPIICASKACRSSALPPVTVITNRPSSRTRHDAIFKSSRVVIHGMINDSSVMAPSCAECSSRGQSTRR